MCAAHAATVTARPVSPLWQSSRRAECLLIGAKRKGPACARNINTDYGSRSLCCRRHGVLLVLAPLASLSLAGQEHGRTIPLADVRRVEISQCSGLLTRCGVAIVWSRTGAVAAASIQNQPVAPSTEWCTAFRVFLPHNQGFRTQQTRTFWPARATMTMAGETEIEPLQPNLRPPTQRDRR
jgi:hypothetical protein